MKLKCNLQNKKTIHFGNCYSPSFISLVGICDYVSKKLSDSQVKIIVVDRSSISQYAVLE